MTTISEPSSRVLQRAINRGYLGFGAGDDGEYVWASFGGDDEEFTALCEVCSLTELHCDSSSITDVSFARVEALHHLRILSLPSTAVTGHAFSVIEKLPRLEELHCNPREETALAAQSIARCKKLRILDVDAGHFTDNELALFFMPTIEELGCTQASRLTDESFANAASATRLAKLRATDMPIGDRACELLSRCKALKELNIGATKITDDGVVLLSGCASIEWLWIGGNSISVKSVRSLHRLPSLHTLSLIECGIGDEAIDDLLALKALRTLWLDRTRFTKKGLRKLLGSRQWERFSPQPD